MTVAHEIRGRFHAARLHLTFVERTLAKPGGDLEAAQAVQATRDELRELERLVLALIAAHGDEATP